MNKPLTVGEILTGVRIAKSRERFSESLEKFREAYGGQFHKIDESYQNKCGVSLILIETKGNKPRCNFYGWTLVKADVGEVSNTYADIYVKEIVGVCGERVIDSPNPFRVRIDSLKAFAFSLSGYGERNK